MPVYNVGQSYQEVKPVATSKDFSLQATGASNVRLFYGATAPADDTEEYFVLRPSEDMPMQVQTAQLGAQGVWARADRIAGTTKLVVNIEP